MYDGYRIYGPYGSHRKIVVLVSPNHRTTMSYARYKMSLRVGRELTADEEVDHIDDDCTNDDLDNLQILTPKQNRDKDVAKRSKTTVTLVCPECGQEFTRVPGNTHLRSSGSKWPSCCSRSCSGRFHSKRRWEQRREARPFPLGS